MIPNRDAPKLPSIWARLPEAAHRTPAKTPSELPSSRPERAITRASSHVSTVAVRPSGVHTGQPNPTATVESRRASHWV